MKYLLIILFCCGAFISCKKDKLEGDKLILMGEWEWIRTQHTVFNCYEPGYSETFTPSNQEVMHEIEFTKSGKVIFYEAKKKLFSRRIVFSSFYDDNEELGWDSAFYFGINMDNNYETANSLTGHVSTDSLLIISRFPFANDEDGCESYLNYFVKQ